MPRAPSLPDEHLLIEALFRSLPGLAYVFDETGHFVRWNEGYRSLLGLRDEQISTMIATETVVERDRERIRRALAEVLAGKEVALECSLRVGGREVPIYCTGALVKINNRSYIVGTATDISARLATEAALAQSERKYREIFNSTNDAMVIHDSDGRVLDVNDAWCAMFGCRRDEVIGKTASHFAFLESPYSERDAREVLRRAALGPQVFEWPCTRANGEVFWAEVALRASEIAGEKRVIAAVRDITERRRSGDDLRTSEAKFRQFFDGAADAIFVHDRNGNIVDVNRAASERLGYSVEELQRMAVSDIVPGLSHVDLERLWAEVKTGGTVNQEGTHRRKDGTTFPVDVHVIGFTYGERLLIFASARDITNRKHAEAALRDHERRLALAVSATADAVWEWDLDTGTSYFSPRWYEMLGCADLQERSLKRWTELCHPDDITRVSQRILAGFEDPQGIGTEVEFRVRRVDGTWAWVLGRGAVVERDVHGKPRVISGTISDVTRRHEAEREIKEWKQRYDLLTRAAGQIVYDRDATGGIIWGGAVTPMLGYSRDELQGGIEEWQERIHPADRDETIQRLAAARAGGIAFVAEYRFRHESGEYALIQDTGYPQFDDEGRVLRYIGVMADVTEKSRAEAERQRLEETLRHAQKMESIGRLAGGIAHDFNNLLTAISGNLSMAMLSEASEPSTADMLIEAAKAADSAANLTRQLLAFSRKQVIHPKVLCLNDTVLGLKNMLRRLLGEDVELCVKLASDLGQVQTDESQIEQVLVNLAVNARDAMPEGGKLLVETANHVVDGESRQLKKLASPDRYVRLMVSDSGAGMSAEVKERLFEPFFTTKAIGKGTGLGLAMVYGAIQQNHGYVTVDSELGHGTTISVYLPRIDASPEISRATTDSKLTRGVERIVIVEDEEQVRTLAVRILERQGYQVQAFGSGEAALAALPAMGHVDLLMTDVIMPGMNGRILAEHAQLLMPDVRILFTSGYTEDVIGHHGVLDHGIEFIAKPYSVQSLTRRVREILDQAQHFA